MHNQPPLPFVVLDVEEMITIFETSQQTKDEGAKWGIAAGLATFVVILGAWFVIVAA